MGSVEPAWIDEVADRAGVDAGYVLRLIELGALDPTGDGYRERDVHLVALLHMWEGAGLSVVSILAAAAAGVLSFDFLDTPAWTLPERLDRTYRDLAAAEGIPLQLLVALESAIGFAPPEPDERIGPDDIVMARLAHTALHAGTTEESVLRLFRLYADNLRRLAAAEAELYVADVERRWREEGAAEDQLMRKGAEAGRQMRGPVEAALVAIYNRHRQHVWSGYSIGRAEEVLERAGLYEKVTLPPAICFVDLTGYTRLTEERGDQAAAALAARLSMLVDDIARRHAGRPIRWLGDGGMFHFKEPSAAVLASLEMVESAPAEGLPPMHIGVEAGPVVLQDGDVYGRTVNVASRIAARAGPGEVLAGEELVRQVDHPSIRFESLGPADLKGIARPVGLYRVSRARD
jgi:adenylate cyclase